MSPWLAGCGDGDGKSGLCGDKAGFGDLDGAGSRIGEAFDECVDRSGEGERRDWSKDIFADGGSRG